MPIHKFISSLGAYKIKIDDQMIENKFLRTDCLHSKKSTPVAGDSFFFFYKKKDKKNTIFEYLNI